MIDPIGEGLRAASTGSSLAYPLVFAAGIVTSIGPCVAPRYVAVAALAGASRNPWRPVATFALGVVSAYVAIGSVLGALTFLQTWSTAIDVILAATLGIAGVVTLVRGSRHRHDERVRVSAGAGGTLLLGASSAFVVSPCCTPIVAAIAGLTSFGGRPIDGALLMAAFAIGHVVPLVILAAVGTRLAAWSARFAASAIPNVIGGTLMLALAAFYGVVA